MTKYQVTVEAIIRKTYVIKAKSSEKAQEMAQDMFTVEPEHDYDEYYDQQVVDIEEV